jgi:glycosyltransferase involved in cell wall biosynthesis
VFPIINGVDTEKFRPDIGAGQSCRKELGIKADEMVIGSVGRLAPVKDYPTFLRAAATALAKIPGSKLLLVGDGASRQELEDLAVTLGINDRVIFAGARKDIPALLNAMDIFVLPSISEGLSNTILEAMSTGISVIATDVGGNAEIIINNETGALTPVSDHIKLANEILSMADERKRALMGCKGRNRVLEYFSIQRMVSDYEKLYKELYKQKTMGLIKRNFPVSRNAAQQKGEIV